MVTGAVLETAAGWQNRPLEADPKLIQRYQRRFQGFGEKFVPMDARGMDGTLSVTRNLDAGPRRPGRNCLFRIAASPSPGGARRLQGKSPLQRTRTLPKPRRLCRFSISTARFALFNSKRDNALLLLWC
jgi:hypothetical protein